MKIAVNARGLSAHPTGQLSRFTDGLLRSLTSNNPQHEFYIFSDRPLRPSFSLSKNITAIQIRSLFRFSFLGSWWYWARLSKVLKKLKPDVFLSIDGLTIFQTEVPRVTFLPLPTITFENKFFNHSYSRSFEFKSALFSEKILVGSPENKQKVKQKFAIEEKKITVVSPAANPDFKKINFAQQIKVREKYTAGESYFLVPEVPESEAYLNLIIAGFYLLKERSRNDLKLLIVGQKNKKVFFAENTNKPNDVAEEVLYTEPISAETLAGLYAAAVATIYFHITGGLNLPVLEAQQSGCPLIILSSSEEKACTSISALFLINPSAEDILDAMAQVYHNIEFRTKMVKQGLENAASSSWSESSRTVMQLLETTVKAKNNAGAPV